MVLHVSLTTVARVGLSTPYSYLIKVTLVTREKSDVQFDSTKHRRVFSESSCSSTGPMRGGPYGISWKNSLARRVIQYN